MRNKIRFNLDPGSNMVFTGPDRVPIRSNVEIIGSNRIFTSLNWVFTGPHRIFIG